MKVCEVLLGTRRTIQRLLIGLQLNQVGQKQIVPQDLTAATTPQAATRNPCTNRSTAQRFLGSLHTRLHPNQITDLVLQELVYHNQKIDRTKRLGLLLLRMRHRIYQLAHARPYWSRVKKRE